MSQEPKKKLPKVELDDDVLQALIKRLLEQDPVVLKLSLRNRVLLFFDTRGEMIDVCIFYAGHSPPA